MGILRKNLAADGLNQVLSIIFPIFIQFYIIRKLLLEDIGYINIITSGYAILALLSGYSLIYLIKEISGAAKSDQERCDCIITNSIALAYFVIVVPLICMAFWLAMALPGRYHLIFILAIPIVTAPLAADYYFQATLKNDLILYRRTVCKIINIILIVLLVQDEDDYYVYALIFAGMQSLEHLINFFYIRKRVRLILLSLPFMKEIFMNSVKYFPFRLTYNTLPHYAILLGASYFSVQTIAVFSILFKMINLATTFITSSVMVIFPFTNSVRSSASSHDIAKMNRIYLRNTIIVSVLVALVIIGSRDIVFEMFLNNQIIPNMGIEFSILAFFIVIHSAFNYIVFNYYLAIERVLLVTALSAMKIAIFIALIYICFYFKVEIWFSVAVIVSAAIPLIILVCDVFRDGDSIRKRKK